MADDFVEGFEEGEVTLEGPFDPAGSICTVSNDTDNDLRVGDVVVPPGGSAVVRVPFLDDNGLRIGTASVRPPDASGRVVADVTLTPPPGTAIDPVVTFAPAQRASLAYDMGRRRWRASPDPTPAWLSGVPMTRQDVAGAVMPSPAPNFDDLRSLRVVDQGTLNALVHDLLDLLPLPADELPLLRAVLLGDEAARGPLSDLLEDKGDHARAERVRAPLREAK